MKEQLLRAILEILSIVAKEEDVTHDERETVRSFLLQNLREVDVEKYLRFFDKAVQHSLHKTIEQDKEHIRRLCVALNKELTQIQKIIVIANLMELIAADGIITENEQHLLYHTREHLKIHVQAVDLVKNFVMHSKREALSSQHTIIIDGSSEDVYGEAKHVTYEEISGFIGILRLPMYDIYFIKHIGHDDIFLNGTPLGEKKIMNFSPGSVVKTKTGHTFYYSDAVASFLKPKIKEKIVFQVNKVSYSFRHDNKMALRGITMQEKSGHLVAVMGSSGSGKSTLLNLLNGNEKPSSGTVTINGIDIHRNKKKIEGLMSYVPQDDFLIEELSVFENLFYASKLCFGNLSEEEIKKKVNKTLYDLGLYNIRDLKVGSPLEKTISGGQRKRLNIGLELIREPAILFVDEPTSGLSSRDSEKIMDLLKELSLKGKLIITVIHQPSSDIFKMFDRLLILDVGGYQIYYGNPVEAIMYFKDVMNRVEKEQAQCVECGNVNAEQIFNIIETKIIDEFGKETPRRKILPPIWHDWFMHRIRKIDKSSSPLPSIPSRQLYIASRLKQANVYIKRNFLSKIANKQYLIINILEPAALALILGFIVRYASENQSYTFSENVNIPAYFFMSIIVALFMGMTVSAEEIFKDRKIIKRESFLNLSRNSYILSKLIFLFGLSAIQTFIYVVIGDVIAGIEGMTWPYWLILFSTSCFANILGLNISSMFSSVVTIYIAVPLLLIPQLILSGVVVDFDNLHPQISNKKKVPWVGEVMASRWAFEALAVTQFKDNAYTQDFYPYDKDIYNAEFYVTYWVPTIKTHIEKCNMLQTQKQQRPKEYAYHLRVVKNELGKKRQEYGEDTFSEWKNISPERFDGATYKACLQFVNIIKKIYSTTHQKALKAKDGKTISLTNQLGGQEAFLQKKSEFSNENLEKLVKNLSSAQRIAEYEEELVQIVYPIYSTPHPTHAMDFRTRFFFPEKHIFGYYIPTLYFNVAVIWLMSILLIGTLHLDLFKRMLNSMERLIPTGLFKRKGA